jgi:EpsI family protein
MRFLNNKYARILTAVLLLEAFAFYAVASRSELVPDVSPLSTMPWTADSWNTVREVEIEPEVKEILHADDTLSRIYTDSEGNVASLFVAFFRTQRTGQVPHSPKNCLPGSGWEPVESGFISVNVPDQPVPITINRYVVQHGDDKSVVLYWYQTHQRVVAKEYSARLWLIADAIRYRRSDTALVRIVIPVRGNDTNAATARGVGFVKSILPSVTRQLPA